MLQENGKSENSITKRDMNALFDCVRGYDSFSLFQDEAGCEDSNFFYIGYLLVKDAFQEEILHDLKAEKGTKYENSEITFKRIRKDDYKAKIALEWLNFADNCLQSGKIRFYVLGVNKNNLKNFWKNSWSFEKNIYLRFLEIGINGLTAWFSRDSKLSGPFQISNVFFEYGNYNDERKNKIQ